MSDTRYKTIRCERTATASAITVFEDDLNRWALNGWRLHSFQTVETERHYAGVIYAVLVNDFVDDE